jgi:hypothetical protein
MKPAVIIPWRKGETELQSTIESATASIGKGSVIIPVEDKAGDGPAMTRHRGIEAMAGTGADVVVILDAHMLCQDDVLRRMARSVAQRGGLYCAKCFHNAECSFDGNHYAGADMYLKGEDQNGRQALVWKWSEDKEPGPRACIGGACYVFRRDWYYDTGQCLSALPAWGCDEEALSITAWLSGYQPRVFDGNVAHRWRAKTPWNGAARAIASSRAALITAVVSDEDRADLLAYQGVKPHESMEVKRWRDALGKQPRTWAQWKAEVPTMVKPKIEKEMPKKVPAASRANYGATETNRLCKCGSDVSTVTNTRHCGRLTFRYRICECGIRRVSRQEAKS